MKKQNKVALRASASPRETSTKQAATTALTVRLNEIVFPKGVETLGQKANFLHGYFVEASKRANGAAIMTGWVLSVARETCAHGQWLVWLEQNVNFSKRTADNYMSLYAQTLGKARAEARRPIALTVEPTVAELEAAAHDLDGKNMSQLYKSTRLIAAPEGWGGPDRGQGRKKKENAPTAEEEVVSLDEIANTPAVLWGLCRDPLHKLNDLEREQHFIDRLEFVELSEVYSILKGLYAAADKAMKRMQKEGRHA